MAQRGFKDVLNNGGFQAFLWTQFLGAFNDNAYRIIVSLRAVHIVAQADQSGKYLSLAAGIFVLPSLFFAGYAGHLADAVSKRKVLIAVKAFEIFAMAVGILTFFSTNVAWMFIVLFLMALRVGEMHCIRAERMISPPFSRRLRRSPPSLPRRSRARQAPWPSSL